MRAEVQTEIVRTDEPRRPWRARSTLTMGPHRAIIETREDSLPMLLRFHMDDLERNIVLFGERVKP